MATPTTGATERALRTPVTATLTSAATGTPAYLAEPGALNITLTGTWAGTAQLQRSFDGGQTWSPVTYISGDVVAWTAAMSSFWPEAEQGMNYRIYTADIASGSIGVRLSQ